ncbi:hypothetical protein [Alkalihalobacterium bogoriense]|uniref:hypothetical protein n=1 Tax=Alkalihalobacterium bogoriense TaxID=246272 RepID=UPI00047DF860|nr:hypothetical protein [Alkalihalobacterium bogoriense]
MVWVLTFLFVSAIVLLAVSYVKMKQSKTEEQHHIEQVSISMTEELLKVQEQLRKIELDAEITAQEAEVSTGEQRQLIRDVLDLHRRGYSFESIANEKQRSVPEIELMLAPYVQHKNERRKVANDS